MPFVTALNTAGATYKVTKVLDFPNESFGSSTNRKPASTSHTHESMTPRPLGPGTCTEAMYTGDQKPSSSRPLNKDGFIFSRKRSRVGKKESLIMNEKKQKTSQTPVYWYFEPLDARANEMIMNLGEGVDECPDKEVVLRDGAVKKVNVLRVEDLKAAFACESRKFKKISFVLYKQVGDGPIVEHQTFKSRVRTVDPFRQARQKRRKKAKQGLPASFGCSVH